LGSDDLFRAPARDRIIVPLRHSRRIVVLGSSLLRSLVKEALPLAPDMEVVAELEKGDEADLAETVASAEADFVIVSVTEPALSDIHLDVLEQRPRVKVLAVAGTEDRAFLWELRPEHRQYGAMSPEALVQAIHDPDWRSLAVT